MQVSRRRRRRRRKDFKKIDTHGDERVVWEEHDPIGCRELRQELGILEARKTLGLPVDDDGEFIDFFTQFATSNEIADQIEKIMKTRE